MEPSLETLQAELSALRDELRRRTRDRWDRDLPFAELLDDRWERARALGFGEGSSIYASAYVYGAVTVGTDTWIGPFVLLDGTGGLTIGSHCSISAGVQIYTHDTVRRSLSGGTAPIERAPVAIGDSTYLGAQAVVGKGVTIGDHAVIGANAFVNQDVAPYAIAVGTPCRVIGSVRIDDDGAIRLDYGGGSG